MSKSSSVGSRATVYVAVAVIQRSLGFLLLPFVTRVLNPADYGLVSVATIAASLLSVPLVYCLEPILFRAVVRGDSGVVRACFIYMVLLFPLLAGSLALIVWRTVDENSALWALEVAAVGPLAGLSVFFMVYLRAKDRLSRYLVVSLSWILTLPLLKLLFMGVLFDPVVGWAAADLVAACFGWVCGLFAVGAKAPARGGRYVSLKELFLIALPAIPLRLALWSLVFISRPVAGFFIEGEKLGVFALAVNLSSVGMMLLMEVGRSAQLEYARETFPAPRTTMFVAKAQVVLALGLPTFIVAGIVLVSPIVIGPGYGDAFPLMGVLLWASVAYGLQLVPMNYVTMAAGRFRLSSLPSVTGALATVLFVALGAATSSLLLLSLGNVAGFWVLLVGALLLVRLEKLEVAISLLVPRKIITVGLVSVGVLFTGATMVASGPALAWVSACVLAAVMLLACAGLFDARRTHRSFPGRLEARG